MRITSRERRLNSRDNPGPIMRKGRVGSTRASKPGGIGRESVLQLLMGVGGLTIVLPFLFAISVSLRSDGQWLTDPLSWLPAPLSLEHYDYVFDQPMVFRWAINTFVIVFSTLVGTILSCALVAYPLARIQFRGRSFVFVAVLATTMLPPQVLIIPQYLLFYELGWINTPLPLILPSFFGITGIFVFLLRQHFRNIPREIEDAAHIDGAGHFATFIRIFLPLSRGPIAIVAILHVVATYNDFFTPVVYLQAPNQQTLAVGMAGLGRAAGASVVSVPLSMAAALVFVAPLVVIYLVFHRYIVDGISLSSGLKG